MTQGCLVSELGHGGLFNRWGHMRDMVWWYISNELRGAASPKKKPVHSLTSNHEAQLFIGSLKGLGGARIQKVGFGWLLHDTTAVSVARIGDIGKDSLVDRVQKGRLVLDEASREDRARGRRIIGVE